MTNSALSLDYASSNHLPTLTGQLADQVADAVAHSKRPNTLRAYQSDMRAYGSWCERNGLQALPASSDTVAAYLADQAAHGGRNGTGLAVSTLRRHLATISKAHQLAGFTHERNPAHSQQVADTMSGLGNIKGTTAEQAPPMTPELLRVVLESIRTVRPSWRVRATTADGYASSEQVSTELPDLAGLRDRALLLVGWCAALRRSELAQLKWGQLNWEPGGVRLQLEHSKTDKGNAGQTAPVAAEPGSDLCPVAALEAWRQVCSQRGYWGRGTWQDGAGPDRPVFPAINRHGHLGERMTPHSVGLIISNRSAAAGVQGMTGHSLRTGLMQAAYLAGRSDSEIMQTSRHRSVNMVRRYTRDAGLLERAASRGLLA